MTCLVFIYPCKSNIFLLTIQFFSEKVHTFAFAESNKHKTDIQMDNIKEKIDFVITWVDGNDPRWQEDRNHYAALEHREIDNNNARFRDWDTLRYWFRGVEKFAPWVNKVFFVTYGHLPEWLNTNHPKLVVVKHEDFIPHQYLPTFSSNVIEFYFNKIKGLSEKFVYFNDDTALLDYVKPERFFKKGLPCDLGGMSIMGHPQPTIFDSNVFLATALVNKHFDKKTAIRKNPSKWYSLKYIGISWNNLSMCRLTKFPGFMMTHLPQGYLKQTYEEVWNHCEDDLKRTSLNRFRSYGDSAPWLLRYWQLASGNFIPYNVYKDGKYYDIKDETIEKISKCIIQQKKKLICLNDTPTDMDFENNKRKICNAFEKILPDKCLFEL